eukprot:TRINITY_DN74382_c0_g1_i1.p1 TRINITY_DN74382_c0_g1~~TRINITY_DN74382_c0_g1_i1.p1  ORF type:complete len:676 (+),score=146.02 TRINITY_DN74382_c0_g1_i1:129-2156(+)
MVRRGLQALLLLGPLCAGFDSGDGDGRHGGAASPTSPSARLMRASVGYSSPASAVHPTPPRDPGLASGLMQLEAVVQSVGAETLGVEQEGPWLADALQHVPSTVSSIARASSLADSVAQAFSKAGAVGLQMHNATIAAVPSSIQQVAVSSSSRNNSSQNSSTLSIGNSSEALSASGKASTSNASSLQTVMVVPTKAQDSKANSSDTVTAAAAASVDAGASAVSTKSGNVTRAVQANDSNVSMTARGDTALARTSSNKTSTVAEPAKLLKANGSNGSSQLAASAPVANSSSNVAREVAKVVKVAARLSGGELGTGGSAGKSNGTADVKQQAKDVDRHLTTLERVQHGDTLAVVVGRHSGKHKAHSKGKAGNTYTCPEGAAGRCGPCFNADGEPDDEMLGDGDLPARYCLKGKCESTCSLENLQPMIEECGEGPRVNRSKVRFTEKDFEELKGKQCKGSGMSCFPNQASVEVLGAGLTTLDRLRTGDYLLTESASGALQYAPVLGILHAVPEQTFEEASGFLGVSHSRGELRLTKNHLLFVKRRGDSIAHKLADELRVGDELLLRDAAGSLRESKVLEVRLDAGRAAMYAPLTSTGTLLVDGVLASSYAGPSGLRVGHAEAHALFFFVRAYYHLRLDKVIGMFIRPDVATPEMHPFVSLLLRMRLDFVLSSLQSTVG